MKTAWTKNRNADSVRSFAYRKGKFMKSKVEFYKAFFEELEKSLGRVRTVKGGPRSIDIDILLYDREIIDEEGLSIPHPELHRRRFVLVPLAEIASYVIHPVFGISVRGLLDRLEDPKRVIRLEDAL